MFTQRINWRSHCTSVSSEVLWRPIWSSAKVVSELTAILRRMQAHQHKKRAMLRELQLAQRFFGRSADP